VWCRAVCLRAGAVTMRFLAATTALWSCCILHYAVASPFSTLVLPSDWRPPQTFRNVNLVRNTNLEKGYVRETINVVVENVDKQPQGDYYLSFSSDVFKRVGGLEVRDKKAPEEGKFQGEAVELDPLRFVFNSFLDESNNPFTRCL
jgi:oligosaccharyltransferase complex subunit alpha (ribophorin I)